MTHEEKCDVLILTQRALLMAGMIELGDKILYGSDSKLLRELAQALRTVELEALERAAKVGIPDHCISAVRNAIDALARDGHTLLPKDLSDVVLFMERVTPNAIRSLKEQTQIEGDG